MSTIDRQIRELRRRRGMTQADLAAALNVKQSTISRWESGAQAPEMRALQKIAEWAGIDAMQLLVHAEHDFQPSSNAGLRVWVVGTIQANQWFEKPVMDSHDQFEADIPVMYEWTDAEIRGYVVKDRSCIERYPVNSIVFIMIKSIELRHGDMVVVSRKDDRGLFENTVKEIYINHENIVYLSPLTDDPSVSQPLRLHKPDLYLTDGFDVIQADEIVGLIVASFVPENPDRFYIKE